MTLAGSKIHCTLLSVRNCLSLWSCLVHSGCRDGPEESQVEILLSLRSVVGYWRGRWTDVTWPAWKPGSIGSSQEWAEAEISVFVISHVHCNINPSITGERTTVIITASGANVFLQHPSHRAVSDGLNRSQVTYMHGLILINAAVTTMIRLRFDCHLCNSTALRPSDATTCITTDWWPTCVGCCADQRDCG